MNNYTLTDLLTGQVINLPAQNSNHALTLARNAGYTGMFYSITEQRHNINRWNLNRGFC